jgi:acetyl esterase/lipase
MTPVHWFFIAAMIQALHCTVVVPDYPLLPGHGVKDVFDFVPKAYLDLTERVGASRITVMGDSAGGGLALALCQYLDKKLIDQPSYAVLMSPWLDINMDNPAIGEVEPTPETWISDPILSVRSTARLRDCPTCPCSSGPMSSCCRTQGNSGKKQAKRNYHWIITRSPG